MCSVGCGYALTRANPRRLDLSKAFPVGFQRCRRDGLPEPFILRLSPERLGSPSKRWYRVGHLLPGLESGFPGNISQRLGYRSFLMPGNPADAMDRPEKIYFPSPAGCWRFAHRFFEHWNDAPFGDRYLPGNVKSD